MAYGNSNDPQIETQIIRVLLILLLLIGAFKLVRTEIRSALYDKPCVSEHKGSG